MYDENKRRANDPIPVNSRVVTTNDCVRSPQMEQSVVNGSVVADNGTAGASGSAVPSNWTTAVTTTELTPVLSPFESWQKVIIVLVIGVCMVLTITGNILVLVSFIVDRTIRQPSNYFIASLAATDMLIGEPEN